MCYNKDEEKNMDKKEFYEEIIKPIEKKYQRMDKLSMILPWKFILNKKDKYNKLLMQLYIYLLK